jgi:hypothetical protein
VRPVSRPNPVQSTEEHAAGHVLPVPPAPPRRCIDPPPYYTHHVDPNPLASWMPPPSAITSFRWRSNRIKTKSGEDWIRNDFTLKSSKDLWFDWTRDGYPRALEPLALYKNPRSASSTTFPLPPPLISRLRIATSFRRFQADFLGRKAPLEDGDPISLFTVVRGPRRSTHVVDSRQRRMPPPPARVAAFLGDPTA